MNNRKAVIAFAAGLLIVLIIGATFKGNAPLQLLGDLGFLLWLGAILWSHLKNKKPFRAKRLYDRIVPEDD